MNLFLERFPTLSKKEKKFSFFKEFLKLVFAKTKVMAKHVDDTNYNAFPT
jgi:hypothetical protein